MSSSGRLFRATTLVPGRARGQLVRLGEPLSFWGGYDATAGRVVDQRHPQVGLELAGQVLALPAGRGSGSSSSVLAEAIRRGTAPAAILLREPDLILTVGATVAAELYGRDCPIVVLDPDPYAALPDGAWLEVQADESEASISVDGPIPL